MRTRHLFFACVVLAAAFVTSAPAKTIINVQFGDGIYFGYGAAPSSVSLLSPPYWNHYDLQSRFRMLDIKDVAGNETPVVIAATYNSRFGGGLPPTTAGGKGRSPGHLLGSGLYGPVYFHITWLDPEKTYDVYAYVYNKGNIATTVTLTDANGPAIRTPSPVNLENDFRLDQNYVVFTNAAPREFGRLTLTVEGDWTGLNGLQFVERKPPDAESISPTIRIRTNLPTISARRSKVAVRGTAASDAGIRRVWYSLDQTIWRKARGVTKWTIPVVVTKRTRVFVRAEGLDGEFSSVESIVVTPHRR